MLRMVPLPIEDDGEELVDAEAEIRPDPTRSVAGGAAGGAPAGVDAERGHAANLGGAGADDVEGDARRALGEAATLWGDREAAAGARVEPARAAPGRRARRGDDAARGAGLGPGFGHSEGGGGGEGQRGGGEGEEYHGFC